MAKRNSASAPVAEAQDGIAIDIPSGARVPKIRMITRTEIHPDPEQPRQAADTELRDSIARNGLLQPITVRPHPTQSTHWMIVDGERRWRSSEGVLNDLPCIVRQDMEALTRRLATQLEANTGKSLTPLEEARAFAQIMAHEEIGPSELAAFIGRAPSTVAERVALLELGPWLAAIEGGALTMSHAVKVLLPLRRVSDEIHAQVMEKLYGGDLAPAPEDRDTTVEDFRRSVMPLYKPYLYPLTKSKSFGAKNPEFNTAKHDQECGCGVVKIALGYETERAYCANPDWWRPLDRAGVKARKAKEAKAAAKGEGAADEQKRVYLPAGANVQKLASWQDPRGAVLLTTTRGTWEIGRSHGAAPDFNPAEVAGNCAPTDLIELQSSAHDFPRVAIREGAASLANARAAWAARWSARREELAEVLGQQLLPHIEAHRVHGPGARQLLIALAKDYDSSVSEQMIDVAEAVGVSLPDLGDYGRSANDETWLPELATSEVELLASGLAALLAASLTGVTEQLGDEQRDAFEGIAKKKVPWLKAPKGKKGATAAPLAIAGRTISDETIPLPLDDDEEDDGGWAPTDAEDDGEDLWEGGVDEDDEDAEAPLVEARTR